MTRVTVLAVLILLGTGCCLGQLDKTRDSCSRCYCNSKEGRCQSSSPPDPNPWEEVDALPLEVALRPSGQIEKEDLPEGCSLDTDAKDANVAAEVNCRPRPGGESVGNGDCCCEAFNVTTCPKSIYCDGKWFQVVNGVINIPGGPLYQCWPLIKCGEPGQCMTDNCQPIMENRPVLVWVRPKKWGWRMCPQQTGCKCMGNLNIGPPHGIFCEPRKG